MKLVTPEIVWHGKEPIFTADFHRSGPKWRLATGGADNDVKIWKVSNEQAGVKISFLSSLSRHTRAVNVVRFSPNGEYLASAGDDNVVFIWSKSDEKESSECNILVPDTSNKENWTVVKVLRGHLEDIYDLSWSSDCCNIITGSVDNTAIVWDVQKGASISILKESRQYIQGVSWDPLGKFIATISNDRNLRVYGTDYKYRCLHAVSKLALPPQDGETKHCKMWIDERLNSFFRRLSFTPDGLFLIVPAGRFELANQSKNATYIFARNDLSRPVLQLPGPDKPTVVVKCCPVPFELMKHDSSLISLPYRLVYAVASLDSIFFYDTQHSAPFAHVSNIHYSGITDISWSNDGTILIVTSSDCYCSIVTFEPNELGIPMESSIMFSPDSSPKTNKTGSLQLLASEGQPERDLKDTAMNLPTQETSSPSGKPRRIRPTMISTISGEAVTGKHLEQDSRSTNMDLDPGSAVGPSTTTTSKPTPRRVDFITLSSFKKANPSSDQNSSDRKHS